MIIESYSSKVVPEFHVVFFKLDTHTVNSIEEMCVQYYETSELVKDELIRSIKSRGFFPDSPVFVNRKENRIVDGVTRTKAACAIVKANPEKSFLIPAIYTDRTASEFNPMVRGISKKELKKSIAEMTIGRKLRNVKMGSKDRALGEIIEAARFIEYDKTGDPQAFASDAFQRFVSKVMNHRKDYIDAYIEVTRVFHEMDLNIANYKFSHWLALFVTTHATQAAVDAAKRRLITNGQRGSRTKRFNVFKACQEEALVNAI